MAEEQAPALPDELDQWLEERVDTTDRNREEVLARAVATYRLLSMGEESLSDGAVPTLDERLETLQARVEQLDADTDERIEDVRERVIQVLKTAKGKADPDHEHPELTDPIDTFDAELADLSTAVSALEGDVDELADRVEDGFENYETILTSLTDRADAVERKLDKLAGAVVDLRKRAVELESANARRAAVEELQADAGAKGIRAGNCESCGHAIELGLLTAPRCPYCQEALSGVEPGGRFLSSATITVGDQPALAGESFETESPQELFEDDE